MILTNDEELARQAKHLTTTAKLPHRWEFFHDQVAWNYRLPNLNAALGCAQIFNFLGDGLQRARQTLIDQGANLPVWPSLDQLVLKNTISSKQITA